jgi:hypothetical protein
MEARLALDARLGHLKFADDIRMFRERISGAPADRPEPGRLSKIVERGNVVVVTRLDEAALCVPSDDPREHGAGTGMVARGEASEANLHRIEAPLAWLQSEVEECRLPRAAPMPLVPGLPIMEPVIDSSALDPTMQRLFWLGEQQTQPQPPQLREGGVFWPRAVRVLIACGIAVPLYFFAGATPLHKYLAEDGELAPPATPAVLGSSAQHPLQTRVGPRISMAGPESAPAQQGMLTPEPMAVPGASLESTVVPASKTASLQDLKLLFDRGKQFFEAGDLVSARILFLRAANAGDATAVMAMGATYDPVVLTDRGVRGVPADLDKARSWYERAKEMGSPEGPRRLEMLANR